jgi:hypothetical protein
MVIMAQHQDATENWIRVLGVVATLSIFTILYKENPLFRFMEHIFIGLATGYGLVLSWQAVAKPLWYLPMMPGSLVKDGQGHWWLVFAFLIGLLFFTIYFPKLSWMNRFAISILMGWAAGAALQAFMGLIGPQIVAALKAAPITVHRPETAAVGNNFYGLSVWWHPFSLISLIVLACVFAYFFFSVEHRRAWIRKPSVVGRYFLMITLGAIFGMTVMGRFSLVIDRLNFLIESFKGWIH